MSISALSSTLVGDLSQQQNPFRQVRQDFRQLASALQNGDLTEAQSAYANIQQVLGTNAGSSNSSGSNTLENDFSALGQALSAGNLSQAQSAFSQLQTDAAAGPGQGATAATDQYTPSQSPIVQALEDYGQLASSLQNGDLTDAQTAYTNLQQLVQAYSGPSDSNSTIQNDFTTLGQDLQTNNLSGAQNEFSQLQSDIQAAQNPAQQVQQDYAQLASALQTGNLTGAQSAFAALQQTLQSQTGSNTASGTSTSPNTNDPIANDLNALGQALSSGNLSQAQSAFSQLQNDIQAQQSGTSQSSNAPQGLPVEGRRSEGHHHHHGDWGAQNSSSTTSSANNSYAASNTSSSVNLYA